MISDDQIRSGVRDYYGKILTKTEDLKISAKEEKYCTRNKLAQDAIDSVHRDITKRYYGCGVIIPEKLKGMHVLDLGSGSGRDCFAISKLVGQEGLVTGIDMTDEQIEISRRYIPYHTEKYGLKKANVEFVQGFIENMTEAGLKESSYDIIVSNCVINLCPDKEVVFQNIWKMLKVGGELYFSDMYADRTVPGHVSRDTVMWGEGFGGALWWKEFLKMARESGFSTPRLVTTSYRNIHREDFKEALGATQYASVTYRLFKLPENILPATTVKYIGGVMGHESVINFDHETDFKIGEEKTVSGELATILHCSRFRNSFQFTRPDTIPACSQRVNETNPFEYLRELERRGQKREMTCTGQKH